MKTSDRITICLSRYHAVLLKQGYEEGRTHSNVIDQELRRALAPRPKSSQVKKTEKRNRAKQLTAKEIRIELEKRSAGYCEAESCNRWFTSLNPSEMDHFFGRGKEPQKISNCWLLCRECHRAKTDNKPNRLFWLQEFIAHAQKYSFTGELAKAQASRDSLMLMEGAL